MDKILLIGLTEVIQKLKFKLKKCKSTKYFRNSAGYLQLN